MINNKCVCATIHFWLLGCLWLLSTSPLVSAQTSPVFPAERANRQSLLSATEHVRKLSDEQLCELVPVQSGLHYVGCPNCRGGRQENQLEWSFEKPDEVVCHFCQHRYPSEKYPVDKSVQVRTPTGKPAVYPYWENDSGYRFFFMAKRDDEARKFMAAQARDLALLYQLTHDEAYAHQAAVILDRFAELFPGWCFHYDYPFKQKEIYDGAVSASQYRSGYRTARWTWWAYSDIPLDLIRAYDWISGSRGLEELSRERGMDVAARIESDLIRSACDQVLGNKETLSNMSPTAWYGLVVAGRVVKEPEYLHAVVRRLTQFVDSQFFYDGVWSEGSPDYGSQSVNGLQKVLSQLEGYSDPPGYIDPVDGQRFDNLSFATALPQLELARNALRKWRLPNGRSVPVHDTWSTSQRGATSSTEPYLLPAVGHACLGGGQGPGQFQLHLTWSGGYGHSHGDNLSMLLYARERELLSDLGYTHTAYRSWTLATAAHNTVVIDGQNQVVGNIDNPTDGQLLDADLNDARVQYVAASGERGYAKLAKQYQRRMLLIQGADDRRYLVDCFDVRGGAVHDYFLHGDADRVGKLVTALPLQPLDTLLPAGFDWTPTRNEGETGRIAQPYYAYGFLNHLRSAKLQAAEPNRAPLTVDLVSSADSSSAQDMTVRLHLLPQPGSELIAGDDPSIRQAKEDDSQLEEYRRPFMLLRHTDTGSGSRFVTVMEEFADQAVVGQVQQLPHDSATILKVALTTTNAQTAFKQEDWIVLDAAQPVSIPIGDKSLKFQGAVGYAAVRDGQAQYLYARGTGAWTSDNGLRVQGHSGSAPLVAMEDPSIRVDAAGATHSLERLTQGDIVRLQTHDGWTYPFTVVAVTKEDKGWSIKVAEELAFTYDASTAQLTNQMFPKRKHTGVVTVHWNTSERMDR